MSQRYYFLIAFAFLGILTAITYFIVPPAIRSGKVQLVWTTDSNPQRQPQVALFNKLYPEDHLTIDPDNSGEMKVLVQCSAGMGPDIIGHVGEYSIMKYYSSGVLWDVTKEAKSMGFGPDTLPESIKSFVMIEDLDKEGKLTKRQYAYPCSISHQFILYNKNIFDKYNMPYPPEDLRWDQYIKIAKKLTIFKNKDSKTPDIFGGAGADPVILIWEKGGRILNEHGTRCLLDSKRAIEAMTFLHELYYKHGVEPTPIQQTGVTSQGGWGNGYITWFGEGKVAMLWGARYNLIQLRRFIYEQKIAKKRWIEKNPQANGYFGPPVLNIGASLIPRFDYSRRTTRARVRGAGINSHSKKREDALNFLQYLASPQYSELINKGADSKPGNKAHVSLENLAHPDWPEEKQINEVAIKAVSGSRIFPRSMFVSYATITRNLKLVTDKIVNDNQKSLTKEEIAQEMKKITENINLEIARNIKRNPKLKKLYDKMLENGAEPVVMDLKSVK
jgi:ABC-type glycerol-3-phosphate transport system substrate-binding protein